MRNRDSVQLFFRVTYTRMGLDAVVYRSKKNLPFDADALGATLDSSTGEYCFSDPAVERKFLLETRIAVEKRNRQYRSCGGSGR